MNDQDQDNPKVTEEIIQLSIAAHCDELSEADAIRLNALLAESESARQAFLLAAQDTHDLRNWATEYALHLAMEAEVGAQQDLVCSIPARQTNHTTKRSELGRWRNSPLRFLRRAWQTAGAVAAAIAIAAVAGILGWRFGQATHQPPLTGALLESRPSIAQLTMANGCSWGGGSPQFTGLDSPVRTGDEISLHEGIAEFRLSSGVSLSIEGPAALVMTSPTSLVLQHGRMTVYVPPRVADFRLVAAGCRITCRATEFGVQVAGGDIDIHAFSGQIEAAPALFDERVTAVELPVLIQRESDLPAGAEFAKVAIEVKRGLELASRGDDTIVSRWHPADESQFATKLTMAGGLPISRAYVDSVLKAKPMGYWRFEKATEGIIANELGSVAPLVISGDVRFVGDAGNRAVELGRPGFNGAMYCRNEVVLPHGADYSVEVWMKPSHFHNGGIVNMSVVNPSDKKINTALYLQIVGMGDRFANPRQQVRFLHRDPPGGDALTGTNCYSKARYRLRRWQHVVAVKQGSELRLYLDGVLADTQHDDSSLAGHLRMVVGQLGEGPPLHSFIGHLDELAIYHRALSLEEISKRFGLIDWQQEPTAKRGDDRI